METANVKDGVNQDEKAQEDDVKFTEADAALVKSFIQRQFEGVLINLINTNPELLRRIGYGAEAPKQ